MTKGKHFNAFVFCFFPALERLDSTVLVAAVSLNRVRLLGQAIHTHKVLIESSLNCVGRASYTAQLCLSLPAIASTISL